MKNELVNFTTAKLAQEKGFNIHCDNLFYIYNNNKLINKKDEISIEFFDGFIQDLHGYKNYRGQDAKDDYLSEYLNDDIDYYISAPTRDTLKTWLREKHSFHVEAHPIEYTVRNLTTTKWDFSISYLTIGIDNHIGGKITKEVKIFDSYEEALETGEQKALKLIKV